MKDNHGNRIGGTRGIGSTRYSLTAPSFSLYISIFPLQSRKYSAVLSNVIDGPVWHK